MKKTCPKCGRELTPQDPSQDECPRCGIIYKRYAQYLAARENRGSQQQQEASLQDQLIDEIHRRVLEKEQRLQEEKEWQLRTQATFEALQEVTEVPYDQVTKIGKEVHQEYSQEEDSDSFYTLIESERRRFFKLAGLTLAGILFVIIGGNAALNYWKFSRISCTAIFTTDLDSNYKPRNDLKEFSMTGGRIYFWIRFQGISEGQHHLEAKIFDASGQLSYNCSGPFPVKSSDSWIWCEYSPNTTLDAPGLWKFETYLDGKHLLTEHFSVNADES